MKENGIIQSMKSRKLGRPITKELQSLNADDSSDYYELLYHFFPRDQKGTLAEIAAFCYFVQEWQQIIVQKSLREKKLMRESIFQEKFFTNIFWEAYTGTKYLKRKILSIFDIGSLNS